MPKPIVRFGARVKLEDAANCPCCGLGPLNGARSVSEEEVSDDRRPRPGDWQICGYCKHWLVTTEGGGLRPATAADEFELRVQLPFAAEVMDRIPPRKHVK